MLYVIEDDGTIYKTEFDSQGNITYRKKLIPVPGKEHSYIYYIWDDTFKQWVFDPNQGWLSGNDDSYTLRIFNLSSMLLLYVEDFLNWTVGLSFASNHIGNEAQDLRDQAEQLRDQAAIDGGG